MARNLRRDLESTSRSLEHWAGHWQARVRQIDLICTASAVCWLLVRGLVFMLRRVRW